MATKTKDIRAQEVEQINQPKGEVPPEDPDFVEGLKDGVRQAGGLFGTDMQRDDRALREQWAENPRPNEDH
jgi:hypothetical protein